MTKKFKGYEFPCVGETIKKIVFFSLRKGFVKKKSDHEFFYKNFLIRFIDDERFMKDTLHSLVNNITYNLCNTNCKYCIK